MEASFPNNHLLDALLKKPNYRMVHLMCIWLVRKVSDHHSSTQGIIRDFTEYEEILQLEFLE